MECREIRKRLDEYAANVLDAAGAGVVAKHVRGCLECREELAELKPLVAECRRVLRHPFPVDRFAAIKSAIEEERRRERAQTLGVAWRRRTVRRVLAAAAAVALFVWLGPRLEGTVQPAIDSQEKASAAVRGLESGPLLEHRLRMEEYLDLTEEKMGPAPETEPAPPSPEAPSAEIPAEEALDWGVVAYA